MKQKENTRLDTREFELPETIFVRDLDNRVFQSIALQSLSTIDGISLVEGNFLGNLLHSEAIKGVSVEQDLNNHSVALRIELNIRYGVSIPQKADEIQNKISEEITKLTGLHVSQVHLVFKNVVPESKVKEFFSPTQVVEDNGIREEFSDEF